MQERPPDPMLPRTFRILRVRKEIADTFTIELSPENGVSDSPFAPGQFNMIYQFGVGEVPISISGDPGRPEQLVHTVRAVGTVTRALRGLKRGDAVGVRGPFGKPWPLEAAEGKDVVIMAGGVGIAPLRPAIYSILASRGRFGRVVLLYGARTPEDILFKRELGLWPKRSGIDVFTTVDRATGSWTGSVGVVTRLIPKAPFDPSRAVAFVCGPEVMMRFSILELRKRGVGVESIFLSMERNMKCAVGFCGHCQFGPAFICKDGPVFSYGRVENWISRAEA